MLQRILFYFALMILSACANTAKKGAEYAETPAVVEERHIVSDEQANAEDTEAMSHGVADNTSTMDLLDDPQSLLASRIIYFAYDSNDIAEEYRAIITAHADYLLSRADLYITLEGHADERGSREYNLALGERRAYAIKRRFLLLGVSAEQIRLVSYGEERPVVEANDEEAWEKNRRVEIRY